MIKKINSLASVNPLLRRVPYLVHSKICYTFPNVPWVYPMYACAQTCITVLIITYYLIKKED